ncbi:hypothetical protein TUZN_1607 [Thermoproteus uzoniensis 768-20]|uniref:Thermopsin n=1 Tax=Thermoproteus uzoniensis (strain 768-20) TaxID=999630 RepID=F2L2M6_THEU7|nr:carboxypeptidase-like regulatory domain-containing protein [Thermoproteus uzoniensis]AEA13074.1 hypothetical protein TUZN_1607 [Thermoproteus uzoniensis 768-20]
MHNPKTTVFLILVIGLITIGIAHAQGSQAGGGLYAPGATITYNITWQINTECPACQALYGKHPWAPAANLTNSYSWAAGKQFTLVIRDLNETTSLTNIVVNATANKTGFVTFQVKAPASQVNIYTRWDIALLVNWHGYYFLLFEVPNFKGTFADLMGNFTGQYYTILPNGTVINNYYSSYLNLTFLWLHQFYLGVWTAGQPYNLTLVETLSINGTPVYTWTYKPLSKLTIPNGTVFGPITYLGTYVTSLGTAGQNVSSYLSPSSVSYTFKVVMSIYNQQTGTYVQQTLIESTNHINTSYPGTPPAPNQFYVIATLNYTTMTNASSVDATCQQLVIWPLPLSTLTIGMLYDIKGNPILSPEYFTFKIQENIGGYPLTISQQQGGWSTDITDVRFSFLRALCGGGTISSFSDLVNCFNTLTRTKLINAVYSIYKHPTLAWISGIRILTDQSAQLSSVNLSPRLIVEYSYQAIQYTSSQPQPTSGYIDAVVFQAPLNATGLVNKTVDLTVAILPVQIPLWWRNGMALPNGQPFNNPALAQGLTFVFQGTTAYLNETGQYAVVADPWSSSATGTNQFNTLYLWALPPYEYVPITPGVYADLLTLFNASGYLPLPPLNAILAKSGSTYYIKYLNWSQAVALSNLFSQYGLSVGTNQYTYSFRIYAGSILVGTANVVATYPLVYPNGTMVETQSNVANTLYAQYGPKAYPDAYTVQAVYYNATATPGVYGLQAQKLGFYNLEHAINIAINLKTMNFLFKDFCGNVPSVVNGTISLTVVYGGQNITLSQLPVAAEVPVTIPAAVDQWGAPLTNKATAYVTLNYFGYKLYGTTNNTALPTSPVPISVALANAPYFKPVVYLPIAPQVFRVMAAVWTEEDPVGGPAKEVYLGPQYPLVGFVLVPTSLAPGYVGVRMGESISNASGYAYFDELPLNVTFRMTVRTIIPQVDMYWPYTAAQTLYGNSYADYAQWLGLNATNFVYTLGTRDRIDAGIVANSTTLKLTTWCAKPQTFEAQVYNPVFRIFDKTGQHLLSSQFIVPGPYPGAAPPILANVTLVIADDRSPYLYASRWFNFTDGDFNVLTDFRLVGMTGMQSIWQSIAAKYLSKAQAFAGCTAPPTGNLSDVANALAYAAMASWLANSSTNLYSAVFTLYSAQPNNSKLSVCSLTPTTVGTYDIAHLFLPGMRLHVRVWYMGYLVYDGYVTLTKPTVDIRASVVPLNVTAFTKDMRLPVNAYIGFTLANGYFGFAFNSPYSGVNFSDTYILYSLVEPYGFQPLWLSSILTSLTGYGTPALHDDAVQYNFTSRYAYYGAYKTVTAGAEFVYLPNLFVSRNLTTPVYLYTVNGTGYEHAASFDRWVSVSYPPTTIRTHNYFERNTFLDLLMGGYNLPVPAPFSSPSTGVYTTSFAIYMYNPYNSTNLLNYKTLRLYLPWGNGTKAIVTVKAVNASNGASYTATFNLSNYSNLTQNLLAYDIILRNIALNLVPGNATAEIVFTITVNYTAGPTTSLYSVPTATLINGLYAYAAYDNTTVATAAGANVTLHFINVMLPADSKYIQWGGFGAPVTYIVPAGQIALLPEYADDAYVSLAGSYIARIWIIAAGSKEALCTSGPNVLGPLTDSKGAYITGYDFFGKRYLVVNYIPASTPATKSSVPVYTNTYLDEFYDGSGMVAGLGFPIGGTSAFAIGAYLGKPVWDVSALYAMGVTSLQLPTTALDYLTVYNNASFPILVSGVTVSCGGSSYTIPINASTGYVYVNVSQQKSIPLNGYGFGRSYAVNASGLWSLDVYAPQYEYSVKAYYGGVVDTLKHFINDIPIQANRTLSPTIKAELMNAYQLAQQALNNYTLLVKLFNLQPLSSTSYPEKVLYASYADRPRNGWQYTFNVVSESAKYCTGSVVYYIAKLFNGLFAIATNVYNGSAVIYYDNKYVVLPVNSTVLAQPPSVTVLNITYLSSGTVVVYLSNSTTLIYNNVSKVIWPAYFVEVIWPLNLAGNYYLAVSYNSISIPICNYKTSTTEWTAGTWGTLTTNSSDYDFKYFFNFPELPLKYILDWNARPLANQTVVLFDRATHQVYAVIFTTNTGQLFYDLPNIGAMGLSNDIYVSWFDGYPLMVLTGDPAYLVWVYQQDVGNDVYQLGNAATSAEIRTYVYPATLTVNGPNGQPLAGVVVQVFDDATKGAMFYFMNTTSSAGSVTVYDKLVSSYPGGFLSQLPSTNFDYNILYPYSSGTAAAPADGAVWVPVATGTFSIQRGATVPSSGYSITSTVTFATQIPLSQPVGVSGTFYMQTPSGTVAIPFKTVTVSGTSYIVPSQPIPTSVSYPLQMEIDTVTVNGVPIKLATPFKTTLTTTSLPSSFDLASLGLLAQVTVQAQDGFGKLRTDWPITVSLNGQTVATGNGVVTAYLPLSQYAGAYNVTVATTVKTPSGSVVVNTTTLTVSGPTTYVVSVPSGVISASVVDAFGTALSSSPVQITNVATGTGSVTAEVLAGTYTVSAQAFGYTWSKTVTVSRGQTATVQIVVPTAKISASVVDQAMGSVGQWPIQIIGPSGSAVASGTGSVTAEVLAQDNTGAPLQYNVVAVTPFGTYSTGSFTLSPGQTATKTITVPTAVLQISAVDDNGYPINNMVSQVDVYFANGTLYKSFSSAPVSVEVLAGQQYTIKVTAQQNHVGTAQITPPAGQTVAIRVTVPGTAGITIGGVRIPISELVLWIVLVIVIVIIVAILLMEYSNWRRRRLMQILAPPK